MFALIDGRMISESHAGEESVGENGKGLTLVNR